MTNQLIKITSDRLEDLNFKETYLSIQISLDGFSFSIFSPSLKKYVALFEYDFDIAEKFPEKILAPVEKIFNENILLQQGYNKVFVTYKNNLASLVPTDYFDEKNLKSYLKYNVKVLEDDFITYDTLKDCEVHTVYIPFVNINNYLFSRFGSFEYKHIASVWIENLLKSYKEDSVDKNRVFVNVGISSFEMVILENGKLQFYNSFNFHTSEDFIYYILFVFEQFKFDVETISLVLFGAIEKESELFEMLYKYIRNVEFFSKENSYLTEEFHILSKHANYNLLHQFS